MSEYTLGTIVWAKLVNKVWWPGEIVNKIKVPLQLYNYMIKKYKKIIAIVYFSSDKSFEFVRNPEKICLYSNSKKMEYVKYGYNLYKRQKKGGSIGFSFNMQTFINDVINFEERLKGDVDIFKPFEINDINEEKFRNIIKDNINKLFIASKKKSVHSFINPESLKKITDSKKTATKKSKRTSHVYTNKTQNVSKSKYISYKCTLKNQLCCNYVTTQYKLLNRHMAMHYKEQGKDMQKIEILNTTKKSLKRSLPNCCTSLPSSKKIRNKEQVINMDERLKLEDDILKDWEVLGGDQESDLEVLISNKDKSSSSSIIFHENNIAGTNLKCNSEKIIGETVNDISENQIEIINDNKSNQVGMEIENKSIELIKESEHIEIIESNVASTFNKILEGKEETLKKGSNTFIEINGIASNASEEEIENKSKIFDMETISNNLLEETEEHTPIEITDIETTKFVKEIKTIEKSYSEIKLPEEIELTEIVESNVEGVLNNALEENPEIEEINNFKLRMSLEEIENVSEHEINVNKSTAETSEKNLESIRYSDDVEVAWENKLEVWKKFVHSRYKEVEKFGTVFTNQSLLHGLIVKKKDAMFKMPVLASIDEPNEVDFKIHPGGLQDTSDLKHGV